MKISLYAIIIAHLSTLKDYRSGRTSLVDLCIFFGIPAILGALSFLLELTITNDFLDVLISAFSIFSALLFSAQIAIYGIFRADRRRQDDPIVRATERIKFAEVKIILREINANISYLIFISFVSVSLFLTFFAFLFNTHLEAALTTFFSVHFLLTAGMVLKRAHEVFDSEYSGN